jgi:hypothetical protein
MVTPLFYLPYIPPVLWLKAVQPYSSVALEACENYSKGSWRNRCAIAGPNGMQLLSVPLAKGKNQQKPIREVEISYEIPWQRQHWRSIQTAYGNAPFFEHYRDDLLPFFEKQPRFLFDLNLEWLAFFQKKWKWNLNIQPTQQFFPPDTWPDGPDHRLTWPDIAPERYPQVFSERHGFISNLSALDALMCVGPRFLATTR